MYFFQDCFLLLQELEDSEVIPATGESNQSGPKTIESLEKVRLRER